MEEIDLCWRLKSRGYGISCVPDSRVYHVGGGTLSKGHPQKTYLNFRNNLFMLYKNLPEERLKVVMRWRCWLDRLAAMQFLLKGEVGAFCAVFRAYHDFRKDRITFLDDRRRNLQSSVGQEIPEMNLPSVLWNYYLKGQHTYAQMSNF
jgi:GT2 family glycosyltransferase